MTDALRLGNWEGEWPEVKLLDERLYVQLAPESDDFQATLLAEYGRPGQVATRHDFRWGTLTAIAFPAAPERPEWITHLVFGGCTEPQAREHLVAIGLGGAPITTVYPPGVPIEGGSPSDDPDEL
ncbi:hypothetical protein F0L68_17105 [Solihabitans fulvus]|uniref:Uncharacterized protein n=1 Tax=Solihabitans fulvus TaxID=1892852 RepID=A0A5B2XEB7_9PSEU|nr:hypothetical protein [Solihabitans fulvus]KAA2261494.1 hypothetical protein F0L68_17105 [Solihabitans fulvus]